VLTDTELRSALDSGSVLIEPFSDASLQPASYDFRVGADAFVSGSDAVIDVSNKGLVIIDPGEFAVIATRERVHCGNDMAGQLGLASAYGRQGLMLLSGPQIDPGFDGVLVVRVTNLSPRRVTLPHEAPFLTVQFFKLNQPVDRPYRGSRQGQTGLQPADIQELSDPESPTIGGMVRSLAVLAADVGDLRTSVARLEGSVSKLSWLVPLVVAIGMAVVGVVVAIK
jgi:dCTP deaminase